MQINSIKLNFILNLIRMFLGTLFIIITTPYITRVLGPENLGKVEYVNSIVTYFMMFTVLGIPNYGIREIAKYRDNKKEMSKITIELLLILLITTISSYIIYFTIVYINKNFLEVKDILLIMSINIFCNSISVEWFYQGIENQIYITKRFIIVRILVLFLIFIFIKNKENYLNYAFILVMMQSGSNILNFINLKKYIELKNIKLKELNLKRHIKPILIIFSATIATSIYLQLDSFMIGNINKEAVGIYSVPNKIIRMMLIVITALGSVLLPRISNCLKNKDDKMYKLYIDKSLSYILFTSLPLFILNFLLADEIISIMAGKDFIDSVLTMKILSPILLAIGMAYFIGFQVLYPLGLEKYYTISVSLAAIINFVFNYFMIPKYLQNGAAIGTVVAEILGPIIMMLLARKKMKELKVFNLAKLKYFLAAFIMSMVIIIIKNYEINNIKILIYSIIIGGIVYISLLILLKENLCIEGLKFVKNKLKK